MLLPPRYSDLVPDNHPVRIINEVVESIDLTGLYDTYKGGGTSSYDPRMMLKVIIFSYVKNIYSSRKMEEALKENVYFMWLAAGAVPDHNTLARFRSGRLKGEIKEVFVEVVKLLHDEGYVSLKSVTTDGTKFEADANRYRIVWARNVERYRKIIEEELRELWEYAEKMDKEEDANAPEFEGINREALEKTVGTINEKLKDQELPPEIKKKLRKAKKDWPVRMSKYEEQERILGGRNSYSATDKDATAMRQKDDPMGKAPLKPSYNVQLSTEDYWVVNYSVGQEHTDTSTLIGHFEEWKKQYGRMPWDITADAGYGSAENYGFLEEHDIDAFVKYNYFDREQKGKGPDRFSAQAMEYDEDTDTFICPAGNRMQFIGKADKVSKTGFKHTAHRYKATGCRGCPLRDPCIKNGNLLKNRVIEINHEGRRLRNKARELLETDVGREKRSQRYKVEAKIGHKKHNKNFRRFLLRGIKKVSVEMGLLSIATNMSRLANLKMA